ncbi:MAG: DUF1634 domain-containing protein [Gemmatimonadaceae bacterium]|nr:DUF1634 domain-containing protein [Gemmatimonadaceae bacterium]
MAPLDTVTQEHRARLSDRDVDVIVGRLLQAGVLLSALVVIVGGAMYLWQHGSVVADFRAFTPGAEEMRNLTDIVRGALRGEAPAIVQLGLVLLVATPIARVALTLVAFIYQRDRLYVVTTAIVLALLAYGLVWGTA